MRDAIPVMEQQLDEDKSADRYMGDDVEDRYFALLREQNIRHMREAISRTGRALKAPGSAIRYTGNDVEGRYFALLEKQSIRHVRDKVPEMENELHGRRGNPDRPIQDESGVDRNSLPEMSGTERRRVYGIIAMAITGFPFLFYLYRLCASGFETETKVVVVGLFLLMIVGALLYVL